MRAITITVAAGLGLVTLPCCVPVDGYNTSAYQPIPTTVVVRDGYGNPISATQAVRDVNGNPVGSPLAPGYQYVPGHYQNAPGYGPVVYLR